MDNEYVVDNEKFRRNLIKKVENMGLIFMSLINGC